ncbi:MAG: hypothetical protein E6R03_14390 [Hyphomicrobiaceae bacterium]|nr:MAG: hypothetical protein E6R03_14390 [Hyphomicrobiaceae bacterium]
MSVKKTSGSKSKPGPKPLEYPKRLPYFANLVIRLMAKSGAAQVIGPDGVWLVAAVAMQEDANRYTGPVTFWNSQLCPILGIATWRRLARVRERAIEAGWLVYQGEPQGHLPGKYFARIPDGMETPEILSSLEREIGLGGISIGQYGISNDISNSTPGNTSTGTSNGIPGDTSSDTPVKKPTVNKGSPEGSVCQSDTPSDLSNSTSSDTPHGTSSDRGGEGSICQNGTSSDISSYPIPRNTNTTPPNPPAGGISGNSDSGRKSNPGRGANRKPSAAPPSATEKAQCERLYQAYPRLSHKGKALDAILKALRGDVATTPELKTNFDVLLEAVNAFREVVLKPPLVDWGRVPHPASWFNARRWEDDRETWAFVGRQGPEYEARAKGFNAGQVRSSNERNSNGNDRKAEPFPT